jgi:hypothetical protein
MAAATAERNTVRGAESAFPVGPIPYKMKGAVKIYKGTIVVLDAGFAKPGVHAGSLIAVGKAVETVDNTAGADGAKEISVEEGIFKFTNHGTNTVVAANVGSDAYIEDDQTVGNLITGTSRVGKITKLDSNGVFVKIGLGV